MASILVVDDDEQVRTLIKAGLEKAGHEVREAASVRQAFRCYQSSPADFVVMDILMPDEDGIEGIQAFGDEFAGARIFAMTGGSEWIDQGTLLDAAQMLGASRVLKKPFPMGHLLDAITEGLNRQSSPASHSTGA